ncbi:MAG: sugar ABC transporter permease [Spirochaetes bacterium]|nr:MAG: sugar ABC transporter permease [Spirochaetota bacterium]
MKQKKLLPYLLIFPTFLFVSVFTVWPTLLSLSKSFFKQRLNIAKYREPVFNGIQNYSELFHNHEFINVLYNTLIYVLGTVPLTILAAFILAQLLNNKFKGIGYFRLAFFHPSILPMVSAATIWMFFLTPDYGLFNTSLSLLGYSGPQNWTANPNLALFAVMIIAFWKNAGYYMIFYLAGLQNLPASIYEAAKLDGAGYLRTTFSITLPLLKRSTLFISTIAFISAFQTIDHIFVLTKGGPSGKSTVLLYYLWQTRFENLDVGKASAVTIILVVILLAFTMSNIVLSEKKEVPRG